MVGVRRVGVVGGWLCVADTCRGVAVVVLTVAVAPVEAMLKYEKWGEGRQGEMIGQPQRMPVEEFKRFVLLPENDDHLFEYVGGEVIEKQTAFYCAVIATRLSVPLGGFVQDHQLGFVTGASCYCSVLGDWYLPTAAYMSKDRQAEPSQEYFVPIPPNLVVEVVSSLNDPAVLRAKLWNYLVAGIVLWVVDPDEKHVEVYVPGQPARVIEMDGLLGGGDVLPGFVVAVKDLFEL